MKLPAGWKWKPGPWYVAAVFALCACVVGYGLLKARQT